jgi:hypothetical protein
VKLAQLPANKIEDCLEIPTLEGCFSLLHIKAEKSQAYLKKNHCGDGKKYEHSGIWYKSYMNVKYRFENS